MSPEKIQTALLALKATENPFLGNADVWKVLSQYAQASFSDADLRQETLIAVGRNVQSFAGDSPLSGIKWLNVIYRNKERDRFRSERRKKSNLRPLELGDEDPIEAIADDREKSFTLEHHETLYHRLDALVSAHLRGAKPTLYYSQLTQARAAILRLVFDEDAGTIKERLGADDAPPDRIYKWVERGRELMKQALEAELASCPDETWINVAIQIVSERRADAGRARK